MISPSVIQSAAQIAGGRLITGIVAGIILAAVTAMLIRAVHTSSTRFAVCFLALAAIALLPVASCLVSSHVNGVHSMPSVAVPSRWAIAILGFWIVGATVGLIRIALGLWRVRRMRRRSIELKASLASGSSPSHLLLESNPRLGLNLAELTSSRRVALCLSEDVSVPTAIGFFRPAVLLPSWVMTDLSASELNSILLHELGHLNRWDDWTNLAQRVTQALLFFHPAVWWIDSRLRLEREAACDDLVVAKTCDPRSYAECLVSVAEKSMGRRVLAVAVAAVSRVRETAVRLTRILDHNRPAGTRVSKPVLAIVATLSFALLVEMPRVPSIVVFTDAAQPTVAHQLSPATANDRQSIPALIPASVQIETGAREGLARPMLTKAELRNRGALRSETLRRTNSVQAKRVQINRVQTNENPRPAAALVRTSWNRENPTPLLLLATQTLTRDDYGNCFVSVRAWQILIFQQTTVQAQNGSSSKSI